jgi:hypothetical protein
MDQNCKATATTDEYLLQKVLVDKLEKSSSLHDGNTHALSSLEALVETPAWDRGDDSAAGRAEPRGPAEFFFGEFTTSFFGEFTAAFFVPTVGEDELLVNSFDCADSFFCCVVPTFGEIGD